LTPARNCPDCTPAPGLLVKRLWRFLVHKIGPHPRPPQKILYSRAPERLVPSRKYDMTVLTRCWIALAGFFRILPFAVQGSGVPPRCAACFARRYLVFLLLLRSDPTLAIFPSSRAHNFPPFLLGVDTPPRPVHSSGRLMKGNLPPPSLIGAISAMMDYSFCFVVTLVRAHCQRGYQYRMPCRTCRKRASPPS